MNGKSTDLLAKIALVACSAFHFSMPDKNFFNYPP
jgi:hypothetical protein